MVSVSYLATGVSVADGSDLDSTAVSESVSQSAFDYRPGETVGGDYRLVQLLGRGGMGTVFAAEHRYIKGKQYALKLLSREQVTDDNLKRFQREAVALARLSHPGIVQIYNFGIDKDVCPYYVMEIVDGISLADLIKQSGPLDEFRALDLFIQIAEALDYAHRSGIVHRDIKPSNVMLVKQKGDLKPQIKIVDFGIVRLAIDDEREKQKLTATGDIFGTPLYMSPEQTTGGAVTFASDVYSLGCTLYEVLTGRPPFKGANAFATLEQHQKDKPAPLRNAYEGGRFSDAIESIVARMLAKRKEDRYQSMQQLVRDLLRAQEGKRVYAEGLTLEELEQPLFEVDNKAVSPLAQVGVVQKRWLLPLALFFCFLLCCVVCVLWSKPAAKQVQAPKTSPIDFKSAASSGEEFILDSATSEGVTVTTFESPQQFKADSAHKNASLITVSLNSGKPMPDFAGTEHAFQSDTGKLSKAIALLHDVKSIETLKISSSSTGSEVSSLNQADVSAIELAPRCKVFHLSDLSAPLESFMRLRYLQSVNTLKLANFSGLTQHNKAQSLSYIFNQLNSLPNLEHLVLFGYDLSDSDIDVLCQARHLKALELFEAQLPPKSVYKLSHTSSSLQTIVLANQIFSPTEMRQILTGSKLVDFVMGRPKPDSELERVWTPEVERSVKSIMPGFSYHSDSEGELYSGKSGVGDAQ